MSADDSASVIRRKDGSNTPRVSYSVDETCSTDYDSSAVVEATADENGSCYFAVLLRGHRAWGRVVVANDGSF